MTLEILDKTLSIRDHTMSLDKTQPKKEEPDYATKKKKNLPTTHRSSPTWPADIWESLFYKRLINFHLFYVHDK